MEKQKNTHGGKRTGAGRKVNISGEKKKQRGIALRPDILRTLQKMDNYTQFVEDAILEKFKRENIELD